ncbi:kinase-like domain-containing protein [Mycena galopus ATCC 62051]|nr:kinase-like domain-containing protein [Mycena galopus ATCC 62051]
MQELAKPPAIGSPAPQVSTLSNAPNLLSKGKIHVKVLQARGLNVGSSARPYVVVQFEQNESIGCDYLSAESFPHDPVWNHNVSFDVTSEASLITLNVYDDAYFDEHNLLGIVQLRPVLMHDYTVNQWYKIQRFGNKVGRGEIHVQVKFEQYETKRAMTHRDFEFLKVIRLCTFVGYSNVFQVRKKDTKRLYAMKILSTKETIIKTFRGSLKSPFLIDPKFSFRIDPDLYVVTDFRSGGELIWYLQQETRFSEERARFYIAELILALEHLHGVHDIVYCHLKPENILLDATGHVALCDFGLLKPYPPSPKSCSFSRTTEYLAPEMILGKLSCSKPVDFWSLGVLLFEMCCGYSPFAADNILQVHQNICFKEIRFPEGVIGEDGKQFVTGLLNRNPKHRLGALRGIGGLKQHPFFSSIDWAALAQKHVTPPFKPKDWLRPTDITHADLALNANPFKDWHPNGIDINIKSKGKNKVVRNHLSGKTFLPPLPNSQFTSPPPTSTSGAAGLSGEINHHLRVLRNVVPSQPPSWIPFSLSSSSASTEYLSIIDHQSPYASLSAFETPQFFEDLSDPLSRPVSMIDPIMGLPKPDLYTWREKLHWFEPALVDGSNSQGSASSPDDCVIQDFCSTSSTETPGEPENTVLQEEVDRNTLEMTCGPMAEQHFWPLRCRIRHGTFHNSIQVLVVHSRKQLQPDVLSKLTNELARPIGSSLSLTSFLDEGRSRRERLFQFASEIDATHLQHFIEAVWKDHLMMILVVYEILRSKTDVDDIMHLRGDKAQFILDLTQDAIRTHIDFMHIVRGGAPHLRGARRVFLNKILELGLLRNVDRASTQLDARRLLVKLSEACDSLPSSLTIRGIDNKSANPISGGGFADIYEAQYEGHRVALKRLRSFQEDSEENRQTRRKFCREALIWKNLDHHYVLPFLGIDSDSFPGFLCMVSPWMSRGSIVNARSRPDIGTVPVLVRAAVFAPSNILLDDQGHVRLADFGLTAFADGPLAPTNRGGSTRWMAPELLDPGSCGLNEFQRTFASDIYSFACVCLELYTGKAPFSDIKSEGAIFLRVIRGGRPECPTIIPDWCTQLVAKCWLHTPVDRPGTDSIIESIVKAVQKRPPSAPRDFKASKGLSVGEWQGIRV